MGARGVGSAMFHNRGARICGYACAAVLGVALGLVLFLFMLGAIGMLAFG